MKTFQDFSPYNGLQWERFKVQKTLSVHRTEQGMYLSVNYQQKFL